MRAADDEMQPGDINDNRVVNDAFSNRAAFEKKVTPRTIQRAIRIAERLDADVKSRIAVRWAEGLPTYMTGFQALAHFW